MPMSLKTQRKIIPFMFLLPGLALFIIFQLYPLVKGLQMSFFNWEIMPGKVSQFIGFDNYIRAFNDPIFKIAAKNTILYALVTVPGQMILAMLAALLLNSVPKGKGIFRTIFYIPVITSWVIVALLIRYLFQSPDGVVNYYLVDVFRVVKEPIFWLSDVHYAFVPILVLGIWKGIGWSMVIYLAALQTIPRELEEVATIDGATAWDRFWNLTFPLISPTVVFTLVMLLIGSFNVFLSVYLITGGGPAQQTEVMLSLAYHQAFDFLDFGYGAAISMIMAFILITLSYLQMRYLRRPIEIS